MAKKATTEVDQDLAEFGNRLRHYRREILGYTNAESFALDHDLSRVQYARWESGKRNISYKHFRMLIRVLDKALKKRKLGRCTPEIFFSEGFKP